jgi:hypothetical protein
MALAGAEAAGQRRHPALVEPGQVVGPLSHDGLGQQAADGDRRRTAVGQEAALRDPAVPDPGVQVNPVAAARVGRRRRQVGVRQRPQVAGIHEVIDDARAVVTHGLPPSRP